MTPTVRWLPWNAQTFARARAEDKPVLLSIAAFWSESCHEMDRTTYAESGVVDRIQDQFIPIRVDADRRPDIADRYSLGGLPTTAFLTVDGAVIGGGTFVAIDRMPSVLDRVLDAWRSGHLEHAAVTAAATPAAATETMDPEALAAVVFDSFDREHGGFGTAPKFPLAAPVSLALALYRHSPDDRLSQIVQSTLDAIGWGALYDEGDGGVYRCAETAAWQQPHREKLLDVNATMLRVFLDAAETLNVEKYRERANDILRYVQTWLANQADGGWGGSQRAPEHRDAAGAVDSTLYTGANAAMASAALRAAELFDDSGLGEFAIRSLERIVVGTYRPGGGVGHDIGYPPRIRGLLEDQIAMAAANLDAHDATGNIVYEMMAQELLHYAIRTMWDEEHGGFFDRSMLEHADRIGRLQDRLKPFVTNCEAARVLRRAAVTSGDHDFGERATATVAAMAPLAPLQGPLAAHYLLALGESSAPSR